MQSVYMTWTQISSICWFKLRNWNLIKSKSDNKFPVHCAKQQSQCLLQNWWLLTSQTSQISAGVYNPHTPHIITPVVLHMCNFLIPSNAAFLAGTEFRTFQNFSGAADRLQIKHQYKNVKYYIISSNSFLNNRNVDRTCWIHMLSLGSMLPPSWQW